jgi:hypothetical protein
MPIAIEPKVRAKVARLIGEVGEGEFRRAVAQMTRFDTEALSLDDVVCVYVLARRDRVGSPEAGRRAVALFPSLPPRTADDPCVDVSRLEVAEVEASVS